MKIAEEFLGSMDLNAASADFLFQGGLPNDYNYYGLLLDLEFRNVVGTAALASILFGSPTTLLERITVAGNLLGKGEKAMFDMSGRQAFQLARLLAGRAPYVDTDNFVVGAGATGTYDIAVQYPIIFPAMSASPLGQRLTLLPGMSFSEPLTLKVRRGGAESLGINAPTSTQTFTSYGAGTGNPILYVTRLVVKEGPGRVARVPLLCRKLRQGPFLLTTTLTDGLIGVLNAGWLYGRMFFQVGVAETDTGQSGELASGSNSILARVYLRRNDSNIRNFRFGPLHRFAPWWKGKEQYGDMGMTSQGPASQTGGFLQGERIGEALLEFLPQGNLDDALDTKGWPSVGQRLLLNGDVVGTANAQLEVISEIYEPVG